MSIQEINEQIKSVDTNQVSDGYHTFGELYKHRIMLWIKLCALIHFTQFAVDGGSKVWRSQRHSDGELAYGGGWFVLGMNKELGSQMTYHLPIEYWDRCNFSQTLYHAPEWDGHTSDEVLERLFELV